MLQAEEGTWEMMFFAKKDQGWDLCPLLSYYIQQ